MAREYHRFGVLLRQHRLAASLSQQALGQRAGLSATAIAALERGRTVAPRAATVGRLADALVLGAAEREALIDAATSARGSSPTSFDETPSPAHLVSSSSGLPGTVSEFIGRKRELDEVRHMLETSRLVTLFGTGGIGKSRLALQLAREQPLGPAFRTPLVELGAIADPTLVPHAVAATLGIPERPNRAMLDLVEDALQGQQLLLVLDNCEHLIEACARLVQRLLSRCPAVHVLATSREVLGLAGEITWSVPPLSLPEPRMSTDLASVAASEAVQLFVQRAAAVRPGLALDATNAAVLLRICQQLDGIPLAIELAAARVSVLSLEQLAERLQDALRVLTAGHRLAPPRHQALRATLDWSYGLLAEGERRLFERFSVFAGGCTLEAAEQVCAVDVLNTEQIVKLLARLVEKSLVVSSTSWDGRLRFRLLEPVRQYARERLIARDELDAMEDRHAADFLGRVESVQDDLVGRTARVALEQIDRDHDNFRAALRRLIAVSDAERAQRLAGALGRFWLLRAHFSEGEAWLRQVLAFPQGNQPSSARAGCEYALGSLLLTQGAYAGAEVHLGQALNHFRGIGDRASEAWTLMGLGQSARMRGDLPGARKHLEQGIAASVIVAQSVTESMCRGLLAHVAYQQGSLAEARAYAEAAFGCSMAVEWPVALAIAHRVLGQVQFADGKTEAARAHLEASFAAAREIGSDWLATQVLARLAGVAIKRRDLKTAGMYLTRSLAALRDLGDTAGMLRSDLCFTLDTCAQLAVLMGNDREAQELAVASSALRERWNTPPSPIDRGLPVEPAAAWARSGTDKPDHADLQAAPLALGDALSQALRVAAVAACASVGKSELASTDFDRLSPREREVAHLVARGSTNREIAAELIIGERTVQSHVSNILDKLGLSSRVQIAGWVATCSPPPHSPATAVQLSHRQAPASRRFRR